MICASLNNKFKLWTLLLRTTTSENELPNYPSFYIYYSLEDKKYQELSTAPFVKETDINFAN